MLDRVEITYFCNLCNHHINIQDSWLGMVFQLYVVFSLILNSEQNGKAIIVLQRYVICL